MNLLKLYGKKDCHFCTDTYHFTRLGDIIKEVTFACSFRINHIVHVSMYKVPTIMNKSD